MSQLDIQISPFFCTTYIFHFKKWDKKPSDITAIKDMHFSLRSGPAGSTTLGFKLKLTNSRHFVLCLSPYIDLYHN